MRGEGRPSNQAEAVLTELGRGLGHGFRAQDQVYRKPRWCALEGAVPGEAKLEI